MSLIDIDKEPPEEPRGTWLLWLLYLPPLVSLVLFFQYLGELDRKVNAEVTESVTAGNILKFVRIVLGISGCVVSIWALWVYFVEVIFPRVPHSIADHVFTTLPTLIMLLCCVGCIFVFLNSLFDGKKEKYFRLAAQIALVMIFLTSFFSLGRVTRTIDTALFVQFKLGIYVAFICMFPRTYNGRRFLASIIPVPVFYFFILLSTMI